MAKAVLIMDMPESCFGCNFLYCDGDTNLDSCQAREKARPVDSATYEKPDWCPLRELPEKIPESKSEYEKVTTSVKRIGWNECLDTMLENGMSDSVD